MKIVKASKSHIQTVFNLLRDCAQDMRNNGIMQWNENYPTYEHVVNDVEDGIVHLAIIDDKIAGTISIDDTQSPEYKTIDWKYTEGTIMVVHRLAVSPRFQKHGIGRQLMDFALNYALENNYAAIRLDAYSKNERTINFYRNRNYEYRGDIFFPYRKAPFYCFEKKLTD